jgi:transposase
VPTETAVEVWFQDEARIGQKNGLVYQWARRGSRPRQPQDQRYENAYMFGAICPERGTGAALTLPYCDTKAMNLHLQEIAQAVAPGAHALVVLDRAPWHRAGTLRVPKNITLALLPPRSPELNPVENVWQFLKQTWLSNRVFDTYDDILTACCDAWNNLIDCPARIITIGTRAWAATNQT